MKNELKLGAILSISSVVLGSLIQIIYTPLYINYLGASDYGINSLVQSMMNYIGVLNLGFGSAIIKYSIKYRNEGKEEEEKSLNGMFLLIFLIIMFVSILISIFIYLKIPDIFASKFTKDELIKTRLVFIITILSTSLSFPASLFTTIIISYQKFIYQKLLMLIKLVITPLLGVLLMINGYKLIALALSVTIINILIYILDIYYALRLGMKISLKKFDTSVLKEILEYSLYIFLNMIIDRIYWGTDRIIIGKYIGSASVGIYSIASIFSQVYMSLSSAISGVLFPKINILVLEQKVKEVSELFIKIGRIQYMLLILVLSGYVIFGKEFIYLWLGDNHQEVYFISLWLMVPLTIPLIQNTGIFIMQARNKHKFRSIIYFIIAILNIVNSIYLVKIYGAIGCAVATGISFFIGPIFIINIYYWKKMELDIIKFWKNILNITIKFIPIFIIGTLINDIFDNKYISLFVIKISMYTILYVLLLYFYVINQEEKMMIKKILKLFIKRKGESIICQKK